MNDKIDVYTIEDYNAGNVPQNSRTGALLGDASAEGAYPIGTKVRKARLEPGDGTPMGTIGTVIASVATPEGMHGQFKNPDGDPILFAYTVIFPTFHAPVHILDWKIEEVADG